MSGLPKRFPGRTDIDAVRSAAASLEAGQEADETVRVAGRVVARRGHGKLVFLDLVDRSGRIQILADTELTGEVESYIRQNLSAEKAFDLVMLEHRQRFARSAVPMLRERTSDLTDVHIRVLSRLLDLPDHDPVDVPKGTNAILVTHDLTPSLTVQLDHATAVG